MVAGPSIPISITPTGARAMRPSMMSSTIATPQTEFWRMAPSSVAQVLMTSASRVSVLPFQQTIAKCYKALQWTA